MRFENRRPPAGVVSQSKHTDWHTLDLDLQGVITHGDCRIARLFDVQVDALVGKSVKTVIPDIPFSEKTPGYNLAYAVFNASKGDRTRRRAVAASGRAIPLDTEWTVRKDGNQRRITLNCRFVQE